MSKKDGIVHYFDVFYLLDNKLTIVSAQHQYQELCKYLGVSIVPEKASPI